MRTLGKDLYNYMLLIFVYSCVPTHKFISFKIYAWCYLAYPCSIAAALQSVKWCKNLPNMLSMRAVCYEWQGSFLTSETDQCEPLWPDYLPVVLDPTHVVTNFFYLQKQFILGSSILISKELWINHGSSRTILQV